jgi:hypothetical protein
VAILARGKYRVLRAVYAKTGWRSRARMLCTVGMAALSAGSAPTIR